MQGNIHIMRQLVLAALAGLGLASLAPATVSAAVFSIAPAVQVAAEQSLDQAQPIEEVRRTTGSSSSSRRRSRSTAGRSGSRNRTTAQR